MSLQPLAGLWLEMLECDVGESESLLPPCPELGLVCVWLPSGADTHTV